VKVEVVVEVEQWSPPILETFVRHQGGRVVVVVDRWIVCWSLVVKCGQMCVVVVIVVEVMMVVYFHFK